MFYVVVPPRDCVCVVGLDFVVIVRSRCPLPLANNYQKDGRGTKKKGTQGAEGYHGRTSGT